MNNNVRQFSNAKEPGTFALNGIRVDAGVTAGPPPDSSLSAPS
jgi:hypothetical protein